jgi:hypothetical protein
MFPHGETAIGTDRPTTDDHPTMFGWAVLSYKRSFTTALALSPQPPFALVRAAIKRGRSSPALLHWLFGHDVHHLVKGLCFVWFDDGGETGL